MRLPNGDDEWAGDIGDEKACAHPRSQNSGAPNIIASNRMEFMPAPHLRMAIPPSLMVLRRPSEESTTDVDDEEEQQQLLEVEHGARSAHSSLLLLSAWQAGGESLATNEGPTTHRRLLIFGAVQLRFAAVVLFGWQVCVCVVVRISPQF